MPRILVVDDEDDVRSAIAIALQADLYDVFAVENGQLALRSLEETNFDVAIIDIFMLQMDGMTLIRALRARFPNLPIVVISGGEYGESVREFLTVPPALSGLTFLQKPFRPKQLQRAINEALDKVA
jgi:CheY-like chemotaxis protein